MGFITVEGENQIAAKQGAGQPLNIVNFVLANIAGLGAEPADRIEAMPIVGDIVDTLAVTQAGYVNTNQVVYSLAMDSSIGDYDFNWIGLVDDEGKLIAVTYTPLIQKRATAGAVPGNNLTRNFLIAYSGIQATAAIAVPAETWQIDFNARLQGIDERERLANFDLYGHDGFIDDAYSVVRQGATTTYDVSVGVGYVGGIRINNAALQQVVAAALDSVWLDVSLQGDISDVLPVVDFIVDAAAHVDYTDGNGFEHYLVKLCDIAGDGSVVDARVELPTSDLLNQKVLHYSNKNMIINGAFTINQRGVAGAVVLAAGEYGHDRWKAGAGGCSYTFAKVNGLTTVTISAGTLVQIIEGDNIPGSELVLSWQGTAQGQIDSGGFGVSGEVFNAFAGGANISVEFNAGTLTQVQLEKGSVYTDFERRSKGQEDTLCKRYYYKEAPGGDYILSCMWLQAFSASNTGAGRIILPVTMRAIPSGSYNSLELYSPSLGSFSMASVTLYGSGKNEALVATSGSVGLTVGELYTLFCADAGGYVAFDAEL